MQKIVVAGATGYLGGYVVRALKNHGYWVRALARDPAKLGPLADIVDDVFVGEVTRPETLAGLCDGIDIVFSSIGITRQKDGFTYEDVDFRGNLDLLRAAKASGVSKFMYVSVFGANELRGLKIVDAKQRFAKALKLSGMDFVIIRPNGYFSDIASFLDMARRGRVYLFGDGQFRMNPIHGRDLAEICVNALGRSMTELDVGGPVIYTHQRIAELAFEALQKRAKITHIPVGLGKAAIAALKMVSSSKLYGPLEFMMAVLSRDMIAPRFGEHRIEDFFAGQRDGSEFS